VARRHEWLRRAFVVIGLTGLIGGLLGARHMPWG